MNMLLIGGLFVIALLAIIGVVVLVASDRSVPQTQQVNHAATQMAQTASAPADISQRATAGESIAKSAEHAPGASAEMGTMLTTPMMEEQFYELSAQIRILYQQIQDMEHRLKALVELTERFEHAASTYHARALDEKLPMTPLSIE